MQLIWYYTLLLFTTFLLQVTSTFFTVLYFTTSYHIFTASYHHRLIKNFKKNLPKITTIYCNDTAIYNNNLLHLILLQAYFRLFQHRNTDYILLQFYYNLLHFTAISSFTIFYCNFTASYQFLLDKWDHSEERSRHQNGHNTRLKQRKKELEIN